MWKSFIITASSAAVFGKVMQYKVRDINARETFGVIGVTVGCEIDLSSVCHPNVPMAKSPRCDRT